MFKIHDGRYDFWQWDIDRKIAIADKTIDEVHFCNKTGDCSLVVEVYEQDGVRLANVPNILLQENKPIRVYGYCGGCYTKKSMTFNVKERTKPADYVYTETEIKNFEELENHVKQVLAEFRSLIAAIPKFAIKPVDELPTENISETTVYLLKSGEDTGNLYKEYLYINGEWELLGSAEIDFDLSEYVKNTDRDNFVKGGITENDITLTDEEKQAVAKWLNTLVIPSDWVGSGFVRYNSNTSLAERIGLYQSDPSGNQVPLAKTRGRITTNTPEDPKDCVNKEYLESVLANAGGGGGGTKLYKHTIVADSQGVSQVYLVIISNSDKEIVYETAEGNGALQIEVGSLILESYVLDYSFGGERPILLTRSSTSIANGCFDKVIFFSGNGTIANANYMDLSLFINAHAVSSFIDTVTEL